MRLWSLNPKYLDRQGLIALWREGLLAKHVLEGKTKGYKNHPQLERFKKTSDPLKYINVYLHSVRLEALKRGYNFAADKLEEVKDKVEKIKITDGQLAYEFRHLLNKLKVRDIKRYQELLTLEKIEVHGVFKKIKGVVEKWEKIINND